MRRTQGDVVRDDRDLAEPEEALLRAIFSDEIARRLARAPGGWRDLCEEELEQLHLRHQEKRSVRALQELVRRSYPKLVQHRLLNSAEVGRVYGDRLGGLVREVMLAVALDGRNNVIGEVEIASGGAHGLALTARDILRPLIRIGASAFVLVHNHPSGSSVPSSDDIAMTRSLAACAVVVGVPLVDHVVVAARGGGFTSLLDIGVFDEVHGNEEEETHEPRHPVPPVSP